MPTSSRIIWNGEPGTRWTNDTHRTKYQFVASLFNTCGLCLQYHMAIGFVWGIPLHYGCRCEQRAIKPGAEAPHEFVDFRKILDDMPHDQQVAAIGDANYKLLKNGVVDWKDIVTPMRVRPFREVVSLKNLSIRQIEDVGVSPRIAKQAHAAVNTPEHVLVEQHRKQLLENLHAAGVNQEAVVESLSKGLVSRVSIAAGPDNYGQGPAWGGGPIAPKGWSPSSWSPSSWPGAAAHAAALTSLLGQKTITRPPATPPATAQDITLRGDGSIVVRIDGKDRVVWPWETVGGRTYDEWIALKKSSRPQ